MAEPLNFSEQLRAWRERNEARAVPWRAETQTADNVLPFPRDLGPGLEDKTKGAVPWLDWLRAEPWVPVVED